MTAPPRLILASRSPQRRAILERLGVPFRVAPADVPELALGEPEAVAIENALRKARAVTAAAGLPVLGVDTLVTLGGKIFGKPADAGQARATLQALSGERHQVISGVALIERGAERWAAASTFVTFRALDDTLIDWYLARGEWRGRAGAYAIQGAGEGLVARVEGDYSNVVGLPVATLLDLLPGLLHMPR